MKSVFAFALLLVTVFVSNSLAIRKLDSVYISPSAFFTYGDYSNKFNSTSFAFFNTIQLTSRLFLNNAYDNITIKTPKSVGWDYKQNYVLAGLYYNNYPEFYKFNFAYINGKLGYNDSASTGTSQYIDNNSDNSYIANIEYLRYSYPFYFGLSYTYFSTNAASTSLGYSSDSITSQISNQITLRFDYIPSYESMITLRPNITLLKDGRNLFSIYGRLTYLILPEVLMKVGGFIGERALYFDTETLLTFNQNFTQKHQYFVNADFYVLPKLTLYLGYQNTKFTEYSIDYYYLGIRTYLYL